MSASPKFDAVKAMRIAKSLSGLNRSRVTKYRCVTKYRHEIPAACDGSE